MWRLVDLAQPDHIGSPGVVLDGTGACVIWLCPRGAVWWPWREVDGRPHPARPDPVAAALVAGHPEICLPGDLPAPARAFLVGRRLYQRVEYRFAKERTVTWCEREGLPCTVGDLSSTRAGDSP